MKAGESLRRLGLLLRSKDGIDSSAADGALTSQSRLSVLHSHPLCILHLGLLLALNAIVHIGHSKCVSFFHTRKNLHSLHGGVLHAIGTLRILFLAEVPVPVWRQHVQQTVRRVSARFRRGAQGKRLLVASHPWPGRPLDRPPGRRVPGYYAGLPPLAPCLQVAPNKLLGCTCHLYNP